MCACHLEALRSTVRRTEGGHALKDMEITTLKYNAFSARQFYAPLQADMQHEAEQNKRDEVDTYAARLQLVQNSRI